MIYKNRLIINKALQIFCKASFIYNDITIQKRYTVKKMTLKDKLMVYVYRKGNQIEQEERDLKTSLRLSALDNLDHYEILLHRIKLQAWNEFINDLYNIVINCK